MDKHAGTWLFEEISQPDINMYGKTMLYGVVCMVCMLLGESWKTLLSHHNSTLSPKLFNITLGHVIRNTGFETQTPIFLRGP